MSVKMSKTIKTLLTLVVVCAVMFSFAASSFAAIGNNWQGEESTNTAYSWSFRTNYWVYTTDYYQEPETVSGGPYVTRNTATVSVNYYLCTLANGQATPNPGVDAYASYGLTAQGRGSFAFTYRPDYGGDGQLFYMYGMPTDSTVGMDPFTISGNWNS